MNCSAKAIGGELVGSKLEAVAVTVMDLPSANYGTAGVFISDREQLICGIVDHIHESN